MYYIDTREKLIRAAEQLFARNGAHRVTVRELNAKAGQRNTSALHYHFGSRDGLLRAIFDKHQAIVDAERKDRLSALPEDADAHVLVEVLLAPLAERLRSPSGRDYLRIVPQVLDTVDFAPPALSDTVARLSSQVPVDRIRPMMLAAFALLADRARSTHPPAEHERFVAELVEMATGMLVYRRA